MRRFGWLLPLLTGAAVLVAGRAAASAQSASSFAGGQVVRIGYLESFQPTGWVPMKVRLTPPGNETGNYLVRVHQRDLDGDQVIYQRSVTLTGGVSNQEFWTYFKPQPVDTIAFNDPGSVRERLRVVLCDEDGRELAQLSVPGAVSPLYAGPDENAGISGLGKRLVLVVSDPSGGFFPGADEYQEKDSVGFVEEMWPVPVTTDDLPDRAIGYDGVDAIVWQDADPSVLLAGGGERMTALRQWLMRGGKLIITARSDWQSLVDAFGDLLPVVPTGSVEINHLGPLRQILLDRGHAQLSPTAWLTPVQSPYRYIIGTARPEAIVEERFRYEQQSDAGGTVSGEAPLVARLPIGFGSVTWLALDLSNRRIAGPTNRKTQGWSHIWTLLLGLGENPRLAASEDELRRWKTGDFRDLGGTLLSGSRLAGRSVALVTVALVFFIGYWLIAGPGIYFYLLTRKRTPLSWFLFGASAVVATLVTLGVVRLILRGDPEVRHISLLRQGSVAPQYVHSEIGLYIPEDGTQRITMAGGLAGLPPTLTGFSIDPGHQPDTGQRSNPISYVVNLDAPDPRELGRDAEGSATIVNIPYRSTLKKLEADWVGPVVRGIEGNPKLIMGSGHVAGTLINVSGKRLYNVHIAYRHPAIGGRDDIWILYMPDWQDGEAIPGLDSILSPQVEGQRRPRLVSRSSATGSGPPAQNDRVAGRVIGRIRQDWGPQYWYEYLRSSIMAPAGSILVDDFSENGVHRTPAMLSFFDLLPAMSNRDLAVGGDATTLLRRGARELDVSAAVMAGRLVIVAEADGPLPLPLEVDGDPVESQGRIICQFVLPLDHTEVKAADEAARAAERAEAEAATRPATRPATQPSGSGTPVQ